MVIDSRHLQFAKDPLLAEYSFFGQMGVEQVRDCKREANCPSQLSGCEIPLVAHRKAYWKVIYIYR